MLVIACGAGPAPDPTGNGAAGSGGSSGAGGGAAGSAAAAGSAGAAGAAGAGGAAGGGGAGAGGGSGGTAAAPSVSFASPQNGDTLPNPVSFQITAKNVDEVEVFVDETQSLGPAWNPSTNHTLRYRFTKTGTPRPFHVKGRVAGKEVVRADLTVTIEPDSCEDRFFLAQFAKHNTAPAGTSLFEPREDALAAVKAYVQKLNACGAKVTLGNVMALLLYEGALRVGAYNTLCEENSYNKTATNCDADPEALYSYQFGLGAIHTSNFHPCKGGAWTQKMRSMLLSQMSQAGFSTASSLLTADQKSRFAQVCPSTTPSAVDHYLLGAHAAYGVPKDATGNHLAGYGKFPLFDPAISIALSLYPIEASCAKITDDRAAIAAWGGGDSSYATPAKQDQIMASWKGFQSTCE